MVFDENNFNKIISSLLTLLKGFYKLLLKSLSFNGISQKPSDLANHNCWTIVRLSVPTCWDLSGLCHQSCTHMEPRAQDLCKINNKFTLRFLRLYLPLCKCVQFWGFFFFGNISLIRNSDFNIIVIKSPTTTVQHRKYPNEWKKNTKLVLKNEKKNARKMSKCTNQHRVNGQDSKWVRLQSLLLLDPPLHRHLLGTVPLCASCSPSTPWPPHGILWVPSHRCPVPPHEPPPLLKVEQSNRGRFSISSV